jgi:hypothetical protein
LLNR